MGNLYWICYCYQIQTVCRSYIKVAEEHFYLLNLEVAEEHSLPFKIKNVNDVQSNFILNWKHVCRKIERFLWVVG
jgi:hypothetical protein